MERNLFVLPRDKRVDRQGNETDIEVDLADVYSEFDKILLANRITSWQSKPVERKYAFDLPGIPSSANYLKAVYKYSCKCAWSPANRFQKKSCMVAGPYSNGVGISSVNLLVPNLPADLKGETFSHVFGTNTSALEHFIIKRNLMGPAWLEIKHAKMSTSKVTCDHGNNNCFERNQATISLRTNILIGIVIVFLVQVRAHRERREKRYTSPRVGKPSTPTSVRHVTESKNYLEPEGQIE
jgi:hypothetical protein